MSMSDAIEKKKKKKGHEHQMGEDLQQWDRRQAVELNSEVSL